MSLLYSEIIPLFEFIANSSKHVLAFGGLLEK